MMRILISLFLSFAIGISAPVSAELPEPVSHPNQVAIVISLDHAIELVKKTHPDLRLQELAVEKAREEVRLATRAFLPDLDLDYIVSSATGGWGLILTAAKLLQSVFSFKKLLTEHEVKKLLKKKEEVLIPYRTLEVEQSVKELYVSLLVKRRLLKILNANEKRTKKRFKLVLIHYKAGRLTEEELLKEKLEHERAHAEAGKAQAWLHQGEFAFKRLIGFSQDQSFSLEPIPFHEIQNFPLDLEDCLWVAYEKNPLIKALFLEEEASLKRLGVKDTIFRAEGSFLGLGDAGGGPFSGRPRFGFTGVLTLYDWGKGVLKKRILRLEDQELHLKHEKALEAFESAIVRSYFDLKRLEREIKESSVKSRLLSESKRSGEILSEAGRIREADLLSIESEYALETTHLSQKRLEWFLTRGRLLKDMGLRSLGELHEVGVS